MINSYPGKAIYTAWFIGGIFVLALIAAETYLVHQIYAARFPGTADFFARWYGARELVLRDRNPYEREIELEAQMAMFGRHTAPEEDQVNFAYPLYTIYLFWPLTFMPYSWAQATWMVLLQFALMGTAFLLFTMVRWRPPPWLFVLTLFWSIFFYPGARAIMLGQFSVIVSLCVLLSAWGLANKRDRFAGAVLSLATVKPQMVFLVIPFMLLWAWRQRRWTFIFAFGLSMGVLLLTSVVWVPDWPLRFFNTLFAYSDYVGFGSPLENMTARFAPTTAPLLNLLITLLLSGLLLWQWGLILKKQPDRFLWGLIWTLLVSNLIAFRSATANHVILYLALFIVFRRLAAANWKIVALQVLGTVGLWTLFLATIDTTRGPNFEAVFMHGFLPALLILYYLLDWPALKIVTPPIK